MSLQELQDRKRKLENKLAVLSMRICFFKRASRHGRITASQRKTLFELKSERASAVEELETVNRRIFECMEAAMHG